MSIEIFTINGFRPIEDVIDKSLTVYCVDNNLHATPTKIDHWSRVDYQSVYCVKNRDTQFTQWFTDKTYLLAIENQQVITVTGKQFYDRYGGRDQLQLPSRCVIDNKSTKSPTNYKLIEQRAYNHRLGTDLLTNNLRDVGQFLFYWHNLFGAYYAFNFKQMQMVQSLVTGTGYMSRVVRENGFKVVPYQRTSMTIDQISSTSPQQFVRFPYNNENRQLHLIYSINQYTMII